MNNLDSRKLRDAFGAFMTGVTVVTAHDADGKPLGFTANSFTSVSLDPPLLLVCLANRSRNYHAISKTNNFAVNILAGSQKEVSNTFARPVEDRFATVDWSKGPFGAPVLKDVSAWFDCSMHKVVEAGDHVILIGQVEAFETSPAPGLGYAQGAYFTSYNEADAISHCTDVVVSALIEHDGDVFLLEGDCGKLELPESRVGKEGAASALRTLIDNSGVIAEVGFIYSVFEDNANNHQHISFLCQAEKETTASGSFVSLTPSNLMKVTDTAVQTMLERFAAEHRIGNYGIYFGNQNSGKIRRLSSGE